MSRQIWTEDERSLIATMLQDGYSLVAIARKVNRTIRAIYTYMERRSDMNIAAIRESTGARVHSARSVARLFGIDEMTVSDWIRYGWLKARRNGAHAKASGRRAKGHARYLITDLAIQDFIERRDVWPAWSPRLITDPDWRAYADDIRASAGGHWLSSKELAIRYGYNADTVTGWRRDGHMNDIESIRVGNWHYFWSADLVGFIPPMERRTGDPIARKKPRHGHPNQGA